MSVAPTGSVNCRASGTAALLLTACVFGGPAQASEKVRVRVEGLGGIVRRAMGSDDLRRNVLSLLSIEGAKKEKGLTEGRIRRLHAKAPDEIREALEPFGYYRPVIHASLEKEGDTFEARYVIEPGAAIPVVAIDLAISGPGAATQPFQDLILDFPLTQGDPFVHPEYEQGKKSFETLAAEIGYLDAAWSESEVLVDRDAYEARITLHFDTGPQYLFGSTAFEQNVLDPDLLRGYVDWKEGEPIASDKLLKLQNALGASTYFSRVEIEPRQECAEGLRVPIVVHLVPAPRWRFLGGLGYGTDTGVRATLNADLRRVNRSGHRIETETKLSGVEQSAFGKYLVPGPYPRTDVITFTVGYAHLKPRTSESRTFVTGVGLTQVRGLFHEAFGLVYQRETYTVGLDEGTSGLLTPEASWALIDADDRVFTRNGEKVELKLRGAVEEVLSTATFGQVQLAAKAIRPWGDRVRFVGRAEVGQIFTSQFRQLPPRVRFFAGGDRSVRGYAFHALGTLDEAGNVIGGRSLATASAEVEWMPIDLLGGIGFATFVDVGNATDRFLSGPWKTGVGIGVRWRSPVGMVRIDVASPVSEAGTPLRLHVNIGPDL